MASNGIGELFRGLLHPVGNGRENREEDVVEVKRRMRTLGRYAEPSYGMTGYIDRDTENAIRNYQADRGVRVDGYLNPGGETERELDTDLTLLGGLGRGIGEGAEFDQGLAQHAATGLAGGIMRARRGLFDEACSTRRQGPVASSTWAISASSRRAIISAATFPAAATRACRTRRRSSASRRSPTSGGRIELGSGP